MRRVGLARWPLEDQAGTVVIASVYANKLIQRHHSPIGRSRGCSVELVDRAHRALQSHGQPESRRIQRVVLTLAWPLALVQRTSTMSEELPLPKLAILPLICATMAATSVRVTVGTRG